MSRANSYSRSSTEHENVWEKQSFLLVALSLMNGWTRYAEEFWSPVRRAGAPDAAAAAAAAGALLDDPTAVEAAAAAAPVEDDPPPGAGVGPFPGPACPAAVPAAIPAVVPAAIPGLGFNGMVLTSKDKARLAGKQLFSDEYRMSASHGLHAAARMLCDDVAKSETSIIGMAMKHDAAHLGTLLDRKGRGPAQTREKFALLASWDWLQTSKDMYVNRNLLSYLFLSVSLI